LLSQVIYLLSHLIYLLSVVDAGVVRSVEAHGGATTQLHAMMTDGEVAEEASVDGVLADDELEPSGRVGVIQRLLGHVMDSRQVLVVEELRAVYWEVQPRHLVT